MDTSNVNALWGFINWTDLKRLNDIFESYMYVLLRNIQTNVFKNYILNPDLKIIDGHQFHQYQQNKQSPLNSDGHQFHQYQQNKQSPLILTELIEHK